MHLALLAMLAVASPDVTSTAVLAIVGDDGAVASEVRTILGTDPHLSLQSADVTVRFLDAAKGLGVDCDPTIDECLLQLARVCGVAQALHGHIEGAQLTLRSAVAEGGHVRATTAKLAARADTRAAELHEALAVLLRPGEIAGLTVDAPAGTLVSVDGVERGPAPFATIGLAAGRHLVELRFADGTVAAHTASLAAGHRGRLLVLPRPLSAQVTQASGAILVAIAGAAAIIGIVGSAGFAAEQLVLDGKAAAFTAHPPRVDLNDADARADLVKTRDTQAAFASFVVPAYGAAAVAGVAGAGGLLLGGWWSELFDPPAEDGLL